MVKNDCNIVEFVCTANQGRSPPAEYFGNKHLISIGADDKFLATSSGSLHTVIQDMARVNLTEEEIAKYANSMYRFIRMGEARNIYTPTELDTINKQVYTGKNLKATKYFYDKAIQLFTHEEHEWRTEVMKKLGVSDSQLKQFSEQTIPRTNVVALLAMAESNKKQIEQIYKGSGLEPIIETLGVFATGNPLAEVPDAFGISKDKYQESIIAIREYVPKTIDRILSQ